MCVLFLNEGEYQGKETHPKNHPPNRKKSLHKQLSELFVQTFFPLPFKFKQEARRRGVWANCLRKLLSVGLVGVGGSLGWVSFPWEFVAS